MSTQAWHVTPYAPHTIQRLKSAYGDCCPAIWFWPNVDTAKTARKRGHLGTHIIQAEVITGRQKTVDFENQPDDREAIGEATLATQEGYDSLLIRNVFDGTMCGDQLAILNPKNVRAITPYTKPP